MNSSSAIQGLIYIPDYINGFQETYLWDMVIKQSWQTTLSRRVQHYGYRYDYKARSVSPDDRLGPLPNWLARLSQHISGNGLATVAPDQVIVNEYEPGQGIGYHVDCEPCFGDKIFILSLGSSIEMQFRHLDSKEDIYKQTLAPMSLLMMSGEARHNWQHGIIKRKSDSGVERGKRISLTFRTVII